ncbi:MAG: hypothetical protein PHU06_06610 [Gallionella sp.]|nr:hypothetical protein [Gallionella sp.]MDD4958069.1 hypothetical protein [Gallionella sp.]
MQKSLMKLLGVAVLTWSSQISAVSMGGINVSSTLGQPLKASIPLDSVTDTEKSGLAAHLASAEAYKNAGLEYPLGITFKFEIDESTRHITVSSSQSINIPFVSLLIELSWASGKLTRDYTFLIDPAGYTPEPTPLPAVQPIAPEAQTTSSVQATPIAPATVESHPLNTAETPIQQVEPPVKTNAGTIKIQRGDTLSKIAEQNKPAEVSLDRMMVALYRANAQKFVGKNMNRVKTGTILRLPSQQEVDSVSATDAHKTIHAQAKDWNAYRQQLASNTTVSSQSDNTQQSSTGKLNASVTDKTPVTNDTAKEVLKLSSGNTPTDKTTTAQDKQNAAQEDAIAKNKAAQDEQARTALAAKNAQDAQHLLELKNQAGLLAHSSISATSEVASATSGVAGAISGAVASSAAISAVVMNPVSLVTEIATASKPTAAANATRHGPVIIKQGQQPETSFADDALATLTTAMEEPLYLAAGGAILLVIGGLIFVLIRRKKQGIQRNVETPALATAFDQPTHEEDEIADGIEDNSVENIGEATARFYQTQNAASYQPIVHEEVEEDPIEEARLFLSFGRDAQAEDILKDALKKSPHNYQLHLELLGIYAQRKDVNAFTAIAKQVKEADDEILWSQAAALGRKIDPSNTLYSDGKAPSVIAPLPTPPEVAHSLDFDLGISTNKTHISKLEEAGQSLPDLKGMMDFESTKTVAFTTPAGIDLHVGTAEHPILTGELANLGDMIYDITAKHPTISATGTTTSNGELPSMDDMMFDVTSAHPALASASTVQATDAVSSMDEPMAFPMDFTLSGMKSPTTAAPITPAPTAAKSDMPFTMDFAMPDLAPATPSAPVPKAAEPTSLPFTIDFAMPDATPAASVVAPLTPTKPPVTINFDLPDSTPATSIAPTVNLDFGGINLDMGSSTTSAPSITESTSFQEVANKLDLAKVYIEMDDAAAAREFLEEVLREGNAEQISTAKAMLSNLG